MTEKSRFWNGTATGDAASEAPYDAPTEFAGVLRSLFDADRMANLGGVIFGQLNQLACTGATSPVVVNTGRALVDGTWYQADASVNVAVATPAASTRIDRIVLRKDWSAQTVRVTRIAGLEGGAAPAMTQTPGVTWDIPLCQASITTGGVITITDEREWLNRSVWVVGKESDEAVNNSTTLQNDDDFKFWMGANEVWAVWMVLELSGTAANPTSPSFKYAFDCPSAPDGRMGHMFHPSGASNVGEGAATTALVGANTSTTLETAVLAGSSGNSIASNRQYIHALIRNGATPGFVNFQWAQNTAIAQDTKVLADSMMIAVRQ